MNDMDGLEVLDCECDRGTEGLILIVVVVV